MNSPESDRSQLPREEQLLAIPPSSLVLGPQRAVERFGLQGEPLMSYRTERIWDRKYRGPDRSEKRAAEQRLVKSGSADDAAFILGNAESVIIVPGYGLAVACEQHAVKELAANRHIFLRKGAACAPVFAFKPRLGEGGVLRFVTDHDLRVVPVVAKYDLKRPHELSICNSELIFCHPVSLPCERWSGSATV